MPPWTGATFDGVTSTPAGTAVAFEVRTGNTPTPDGTWSAFASIANGADIPGTSRYIQYRATLSSTDPALTPSLASVSLGYAAGGPNVAPVATNDSYSTARNTTLVVAAPGVLTNDSDANNDPLTAIKLSDPIHGTLTFNANGGFSYVPTTGYVGSDSFTYKANDGTLDSNTATVNLTVTSPPLALTDTTVADFSAGTPGASTYVIGHHRR